jgi:hypothetical protein
MESWKNVRRVAFIISTGLRLVYPPAFPAEAGIPGYHQVHPSVPKNPIGTLIKTFALMSALAADAASRRQEPDRQFSADADSW